MNYFLDTEFIEGFTKPFFGSPRHFIDLISIGIVAEDGREYYAISNEFDISEVWNKYQMKKTGLTDLPGINRSEVKEYWLRENVLKPLWHELDYREYREDPNPQKQEFYDILDEVPAEERLAFYVKSMLPHSWQKFGISRLKQLIKKYGKSKKKIAKEIIEFIYPICDFAHSFLPIDPLKTPEENGLAVRAMQNPPPTFYAYYADYDWIAFVTLFGTMMQLPTGFPMYCRDLKQMVDDWVTKAIVPLENHHQKTFTFDQALKELKRAKDYPKQTNEHNALADARWNFELYKFLKS